MNDQTSLHSEHCRIFLAMLTHAASKGEAVPTYKLAQISRNHTARLSNLRAVGHDIQCEDVPEPLRQPGKGRQTQYRYIGFTGKNMAGLLDVAKDSLKPSPLSLRRVRDNSTVVLQPSAYGDGIAVTFDRPFPLEFGDTLVMERVVA